MLNKLKNVLGWTSKRKIVVFESDDWGSDRFPDKATRDHYIEKGYPIEKCWMSYVDTFESNKDVEALLNLLEEIRSQGKIQPKFTLLFNPANPDFGKIRDNGFKEYYYESFKSQIERNNNSSNLIRYYKKYIESGIVEMAFHGREHLYVNRWLRDLQTGEPELLNGFKHHFWGYSKSYYPALKHNYRSAFALDKPEDFDFQRESITEGVALMEDMFEHPVRYFLAPDGPFSLSLLPALKNSGINNIGLPKWFKDAEKQNRKLFWLGRKLNNGMRVITRNASFEPACPLETDWVDKCLSDINNAFKWHKPAVISTHRANYVGGLESSNRTYGLNQLKLLLQRIHENWPDVIYLTSSQLGDLIDRKTSVDELAQ